jgi:hypothetical protein
LVFDETLPKNDDERQMLFPMMLGAKRGGFRAFAGRPNDKRIKTKML